MWPKPQPRYIPPCERPLPHYRLVVAVLLALLFVVLALFVEVQ